MVRPTTATNNVKVSEMRQNFLGSQVSLCWALRYWRHLKSLKRVEGKRLFWNISANIFFIAQHLRFDFDFVYSFGNFKVQLLGHSFLNRVFEKKRSLYRSQHFKNKKYIYVCMYVCNHSEVNVSRPTRTFIARVPWPPLRFLNRPQEGAQR